MAKVLELQHQSFQRVFRVDFLKDWLVWTPCFPRDSQESSPAPQFESISSSCSAFFCSSDDKESPCDEEDLGSILGSGRSPGVRNGNPLQYSHLENHMDRGAWQATVHGVSKSWTQLNGEHSLLCCPALTSVHDYWEDQSIDYTNFCWESDIFAL